MFYAETTLPKLCTSHHLARMMIENDARLMSVDGRGRQKIGAIMINRVR